MYLLFVAIVWIFFGIIFVNWHRWEEYYPTILYYITLNLLYEFIYFNNRLWEFKAVTTDYLNHGIISIVFFFIIIPISIMIFLQRYPKGTKNRIAYITIWALFYWVLEYIFAARGLFVYYNNWNVWYSLFFDIIMFYFFRLHYTKPKVAIILTIPTIVIFIFLFKIPFYSLR